MSEMVERVARAILMAVPNDTPIWEHSTKAQREEWKVRARAAIEAMREPTDDMPFPEAIKQYWRAMIDEALK